ncbi:hypothetical protein KIPB_013450, partial [Kipferlia bialata]|eukprot:g13450.t1
MLSTASPLDTGFGDVTTCEFISQEDTDIRWLWVQPVFYPLMGDLTWLVIRIVGDTAA